MASSANTVWNIQTDGLTTAGAGFVSGASGIDYSKTLVANLPANNSVTGATSAGAGNVVLTAQAAADWVGNLVIPTAGTNFTTTAGTRFECTSVVVGVSATFSTNSAGASICTGVGSGGVFIVGGAGKLFNSSTDDALFENNVAGNKWYFKTGTHSMGAVSLAATGTLANPIKLIGYNATHGDNPSISSGNQPVIDSAGNTVVYSTAIWFECLQMTNTGANGIQPGVSARAINCKFSNSSGTAGRAAVTPNADSMFFGCEFVSTNGPAVQSGAANAQMAFYACYFHDSDKGFRVSISSLTFKMLNCIFDTIVSKGIEIATGNTLQNIIIGNTFYGAATPASSSVGLDIATAAGEYVLLNNIFSGWVTGINSVDALNLSLTDYNNFYNNTTNRTNWQTGSNDKALDPAFVDAPNGNFAVGTNMQQVGTPSSFPGGLSTSYTDIGAVQSNYASWFTDVDTAKILTTQGDYKYNSLSTNRTPTASASAGTSQKFIYMGDT
jgi:hypothetical protein